MRALTCHRNAIRLHVGEQSQTAGFICFWWRGGRQGCLVRGCLGPRAAAGGTSRHVPAAGSKEQRLRRTPWPSDSAGCWIQPGREQQESENIYFISKINRRAKASEVQVLGLVLLGRCVCAAARTKVAPLIRWLVDCCYSQHAHLGACRYYANFTCRLSMFGYCSCVQFETVWVLHMLLCARAGMYADMVCKPSCQARSTVMIFMGSFRGGGLRLDNWIQQLLQLP